MTYCDLCGLPLIGGKPHAVIRVTMPEGVQTLRLGYNCYLLFQRWLVSTTATLQKGVEIGG